MFLEMGTNTERRHVGESRNQRSISGQNSFDASSATAGARRPEPEDERQNDPAHFSGWETPYFASTVTLTMRPVNSFLPCS